MGSEREELRAKVLAFEDFLNEPRQLPYPEPMDVRDFRHAAYREWEKLSQRLLSLLSPELGGWRGMDRAPDTTVAPWDGNDVLLRCGWDDMHVCIVAAYDPEIPSAPWATLDGPSYLPGWPTHWMPLPPPPTGAR